MGPGFPIRYTGPHIGVRHDARIFQEDRFLQARIKPWEYGLGDKAYVGQRQIITEWKGRNLSLEKQRFNKTVQHYRGRVEHIIGQVVDNRMALCTTWRGSFTLLAAVMKIAAHMVGLQERMKGPRYDVFGPAGVPAAHRGAVSLVLFAVFAVNTAASPRRPAVQPSQPEAGRKMSQPRPRARPSGPERSRAVPSGPEWPQSTPEHPRAYLRAHDRLACT